MAKEKLMINLGAGTIWESDGWSTMGNHTKYDTDYDYLYDFTSMKPFPLKDNSVHLFYSLCMGEHLPNENIQFMFNEAYRCLENGGAFRFGIPDVETAYEYYKTRNFEGLKNFTRQRNWNRLREPIVFRDLWYSRLDIDDGEFRRNMRNMEMEELFNHYTIGKKQIPEQGGDHINWFTFKKLNKMFHNAGFSDVYKSEPGKSRYKEMQENYPTIPVWTHKHRTERFDMYKNRHKFCLYVEAIK